MNAAHSNTGWCNTAGETGDLHADVNMRTVKEVSRLTGVSVRTLHHYDAIGLLKPAKITDAGYRLYDDTSLGRLQNILMFRELQFPLKEIRAILDSPAFDPGEALKQQIQLLELQRKHLDELIAFAREIQKKGVDKMNFTAFNKTEINQYAQEVKERWGSTRSYEEYAQSTKDKTDRELDATADKMKGLFADLGSLRELPPAEKKVQEKIGELQAFISENYYPCTTNILSGLSQMYVCDERFRNNIDGLSGEGTAEFVRQAISIYVRQQPLDAPSA